jgi:DUF4097 and DUF4098 domain-containing protein YvlB
MTKEEYLRALKAKLRGCPAEFVNDICDAFESHFNEGIENGQSEAEIIENLGTVDEVAENIRMMNPEIMGRSQKEDEFRDSLDSLSSSLSSTIRSVSSLVSDSVNTALKNIEAYTNDDHSADSEGTVDVRPGTTLRIRGTRKGALDVFLEQGSRLEYQFRPTRSLFSSTLATLKVINEERNLTFEADDSAHLYIKVPEEIEEIRISLLSGDVQANGITLRCLEGKTMSGDWELDDCEIRSLSLDTKSGDIDIDTTRSDFIELSTYNGDFSLKRSTGNVEAKTASGDIDVREHRAERVRFEAISGDIDASLVCPQIELTTVSGDVDLRSDGRIESINVLSTSGDICARIGDTDYTADLRTLSGDLSNSTDLRRFKRSSKEWIVGEGLASVYLKTTSGDIDLH